MKVKNLLLAGLAVAAMTACSNEIDEIVDGGNQAVTGETAGMNLKFTFAQTRAVSSPGTDAGEEPEWNATKVTVVLDYGTAKPYIIQDLGVITNEGKVRIAETEKFKVQAGSQVKIYAFLNPGNLDFEKSVTDLISTASKFPTEGLNYLIEGAAKTNNFMMSNTGGTPIVKDIIAGKDDNIAEISVERVCAKIQETTEINKSFSITEPSVKDFEASIKMVKYTYANLAKASYVLAQSSCWAAANNDAYFNQYATVNPTYNWVTANNDATYCYENIISGTWNTSKHTSVLYEAQVYFNGSESPASTFYVKENPKSNQREIFKSWEELTQAYSGLKDSENDEDLKNFSIEKYTDGKCYYQAPIEDTTAGVSIVRNNWYKLTINSVKDLGYPTPVPPTKEDTKLTVKVEIKPWTIQMNNIDL